MTCPTCSNDLPAAALFCSRCGTRIAAPAPGPASAPVSAVPPYIPFVPLAPFAYTRVGRHLQVLGTLWLVYAVWRALTRLFGMAVLHGILGHHAFGFAPWLGFGFWPLAFGSVLVGLGLSVLAAYGLLNRQPWGRVMAIIAAIFALIHPVLGTALGIYTLWVLAPAASGIEYAAVQRPPTPQPHAL